MSSWKFTGRLKGKTITEVIKDYTFYQAKLTFSEKYDFEIQNIKHEKVKKEKRKFDFAC